MSTVRLGIVRRWIERLWIERLSAQKFVDYFARFDFKLLVLKSTITIFLVSVFIGTVTVGLAEDPVVDPGHGAKESHGAKEAVKIAQKLPRTPSKKSAAAPIEISPEREAVAVEFARQNHPELASLMQNLKANATVEYQAALADLDRAVERLSKTKEKSPEKHEIQLAEWKNASRIRLLAARLTVSEDPSAETELRAAIKERLKLRLTAQRTDRDRLQKRLEKLDQSIGEMSTNSDAMIDKQIVDLRKSLPASKPSSRSRTKKSSATDASPREDGAK